MRIEAKPNRLIRRVLVCGGRDVTNADWVHHILDGLHKAWGFTTVIEGDARGADRIAGHWARKHGLNNIKFRADWATHGKAAGPKRNQRMLDEGNPDFVLAFAGGKGTDDMIRRAKASGLEFARHYSGSSHG